MGERIETDEIQLLSDFRKNKFLEVIVYELLRIVSRESWNRVTKSLDISFKKIKYKRI